MSDKLDTGTSLSSGTVPVVPIKTNGQAKSELEAEAGGGNGVPPPSTGGTVVPMPAPGKKPGLTLESLAKATARAGGAPLVKIASSAVTIEVRKPQKGVPFMAHPDVANYTAEGYTLTVKVPDTVGETVFLVDPAIAELIPAHIRHQRFCLCFDAWQRQPFIWPINTMVEGVKNNQWTVAANRVWQAATEDWVCMIPGAGTYQLHKPVVPIRNAPVWPTKPFAELMLMGFRDCYIGPDDRDHKEIQKRLTEYVSDPDAE